MISKVSYNGGDPLKSSLQVIFQVDVGQNISCSWELITHFQSKLWPIIWNKVVNIKMITFNNFSYQGLIRSTLNNTMSLKVGIVLLDAI